MITGQVTAYREAVVGFQIYDKDDGSYNIQAVVDTGFTEYLILPEVMVRLLGLNIVDTADIILGDGSLRTVYTYEAYIDWNGQKRAVFVLATGDQPLIGMQLMDEHTLFIDNTPGGTVEITPKSISS